MQREPLGEYSVRLKEFHTLVSDYHFYLVLLILGMILLNNDASLTANHSTSDSSRWIGTEIPSAPDREQAILRAVNRLRLQEGLSELRLCEAARTKAREQSATMAQHGFLAHQDHLGRGLKERLMSSPQLAFQRAGENLARNKGFSNPVAEAVDGWINSPGHRANILEARFTETGVGIAEDSKGMLYFTQIFLTK